MNSTRNIPVEWVEDNRDIKEVIPKAIISFNETLDFKEKVEVLSFLCNGLVPNLSLLDLEEIILCNIFPELVEFVDKLFEEIDKTIHSSRQDSLPNKSDILHDLLLVLFTTMECIEKCIKYIYETFNCINICQIHSLPVPVLLIVKSTFHHCKKSEKSYGDAFQEVSQQLALIFRKAFALQKLLMELINIKIEILNNNNSEKDFNNIAQVCNNLLDICEITENIDNNITPGIWKSLTSLVTKNKEKAKHCIEVDGIVSKMCCTLEKKIESYKSVCKNREIYSDECVLKLLKIMKFLIKLLISLVQTFQDYLVLSSYKSILHLLFSIISLTLGQSSGKDYEISMSVVVEPFLQVMVLNKNFADLLTRVDQDFGQTNLFSRCYTLANVVVLLPVSEEILSYWINPANYSEDEPRVSVLEALLQSCNSCHIEMCLSLMLPGRMCNGKPQRKVSLYEYVVSRLSAFVTAIPSQYFHIVEKVFLNYLLSGNLICSLIVTDVWCFIARWATADLCYYHVKTFLDWLVTISWESDIQKSRIATLVGRLLPLMATEQQETLVKQFPPVSFENIQIWSFVPFHRMIQSVRQQIYQPIVKQLNALLQQWLKNNLSRPQLGICLYCLNNVLSDDTVFKYLSNEDQSQLIQLIVQIFDDFLERSCQIPHSSWSSFINILKSIILKMQPEYFIKVLDNITNAVVIFKDGILNINFAYVMAECGRRTFLPIQDESKLICDIFRTLVSSTNWLVQNEAFLALKRFAEVTSYTPGLEDCVSDELKEDFQNFICSVPYGCSEKEDKNAMLLNILNEQVLSNLQSANKENKYSSRLTKTLSVSTRNTDNEIEKRKRGDDTHEIETRRKKIECHVTFEEEQKLTQSIEELWKHVGIIEGIKSHYTLLPPQVVEKLKTIKQSLDALVKPI